MKLDTSLTLSEFVDKLETENHKDNFAYSGRLLGRIFEYNELLKQPLTKDMFVNPMDAKMYGLHNVFDREFDEYESKVIFKGFKVQDSEEWIRFYNGVRVYYPSTENPNAFSYVFREGVKPPTLAEVFNNAKFELQNFEI